MVTGGGRGIGSKLVERYLAQGETVIATARQPAAVAQLQAAGAEAYQLEVTDNAAVAALAKQLEGRAIDVLVNNAGVIGGANPQALGELDLNDWAQTMAINVFAPFAITQALLDNVMASPEKKIVVISSVMGSIANNAAPDKMIYRSSKAAVNQVCKGLHNALSPKGAIVVPMHPGWVSSDMGGPSAPVTPTDSAAGLARVIDALTPAQSGRLWDYQGTELPW